MSWFQENRWLARFLSVFGVCTLVALYFLFTAKSNYEEVSARFRETAAERNRLERLDPFPSDTNYRELKTDVDNYGGGLAKFKEELKEHSLPVVPLAPNEFQSRLRKAMIASAEKARTNKVKLPDNFHLGFDEFIAALPNNEGAPLLGQELAQVELLVNIVIDARVDSLSGLRRARAPQEHGKTSAARPKGIERNMVDLTFIAAPSAARKVLNEIAGANQQLYVIRTLHVRNEKEKGPAREQIAAALGNAAETPLSGATTLPGAKPAGNAALNFIVGNEHIETSARIEMLRFAF
jgi:hypothetical protein